MICVIPLRARKLTPARKRDRCLGKTHIAFTDSSLLGNSCDAYGIVAAREHFSGANPIRVQDRNQVFGDLRGGLLSYFMVSELGPGPQSWASGFTTCTPITNNTRIPTRRRNRERRVGKFLLAALLQDSGGAVARGRELRGGRGSEVARGRRRRTERMTGSTRSNWRVIATTNEF